MPACSHPQLCAIDTRPDPAWDEAKRRLWAMTADERRAAMYAGALSPRQCLHWASRAPREVPLLNNEFWFIANTTPEIAERNNEHATDCGARS